MNKLDYVLISPKSDDDFERYYQFRWEQLRKPLDLPRGSERDALDNQSYHCMVQLSEGLSIGVGSIQPQEDNTMRIRYMAVESQYQRLGVGAKIMKNLLDYAIDNQTAKCWLNARAQAVDFYHKQGFDVIDEVKTELAVPHFKMEILLNTYKDCL